MKTIYRIAILAVMAVAFAVGVWIWMSPKPERVKLSAARIENVRQMVQLSSMRIYEEIPVKGNVGKRHLVARLTLEGSIDFDLEKLHIEDAGDTLKVTLPPETVSLRESTRPGSYTVIDTWNDNFFRSGNISTQEENRMKALAIENARKGIYSKGLVRRARSEAVESVRSLLSASLPGKTVIVTDPTPEGRRQ